MTELERFCLWLVIAAACEERDQYQVGCYPWVAMEMHLSNMHKRGELVEFME